MTSKTLKLSHTAILVGFLILFFKAVQISAAPVAGAGNSKQTNWEEEKTIFNCRLNSDAEIYAELDNMEQFFPKQFGLQAKDSIHAVAERARQLQASGRFVFRATEVKYTPTNIPFSAWLAQLFTGAKTAADSIELLTQWIPANFAYGESDPRIDALKADSLYRLITLGQVTGNYHSYAIFLCKLVQEHGQTWGWGVPLKLNGAADTAITGGVRNPKHTWVGFAKPNGEIWCLADPAIGGVARHIRTQQPLSLDSVTTWLRTPTKADSVYVKPVKNSLQAVGPCLITLQFRSTQTVVTYKVKGSETWITRGEWYTWGEPGSMNASLFANYWLAEKFPRNTCLNIYCKASELQTYAGSDELKKLILSKYKLTEATQ